MLTPSLLQAENRLHSFALSLRSRQDISVDVLRSALVPLADLTRKWSTLVPDLLSPEADAATRHASSSAEPVLSLPEDECACLARALEQEEMSRDHKAKRNAGEASDSSKFWTKHKLRDWIEDLRGIECALNSICFFEREACF
jgi:hypothetical protein